MDMDGFAHLRQFESDFDHAQAEIRRAASLWALAGFGAYAYAFSTPLASADGDLTRSFVGVLVSWTAAFGIVTLWFIDQRVYQKLLHSVFMLGLYAEWKNSELPPIRTKLYYDNLNVSWKLSLFYLVPVVAFLAVELFFALAQGLFDLPGASHPVSRTLCVALVALHILAAVYIAAAGVGDRNLLQQHGEPYPREFHAYLSVPERTALRDRLVAATGAEPLPRNPALSPGDFPSAAP